MLADSNLRSGDISVYDFSQTPERLKDLVILEGRNLGVGTACGGFVAPFHKLIFPHICNSGSVAPQFVTYIWGCRCYKTPVPYVLHLFFSLALGP